MSRMVLEKEAYMKTLYLHIGTPKTGTTSIQSFCTDNRAVLNQYGYEYPEFPYRYPRTNPERNGLFLSMYSFHEDGNRDYEKEEKIVEEAFERIRSTFEVYDNVIVSDESIWNRGIREDVPIWERVKKQMDRGGFQVKVIVYLRPQYDFLYSWWNQKVKNGLYQESQYTWSEMQEHLGPICLDYCHLLDYISEHVGGTDNVIVRIFNRNEFVGGSLYRDFVHAVGLEYTDAFQVANELHNVSLTRNSSEIKRVLNTLPGLDYKTNAMFREMLLSQSAIRKDKQSYHMFSQEEYEAFLHQFQEGNRKIAKDYLGRENGLFCTEDSIAQKWEPENAYLTEDVIYFLGQYMMHAEQEMEQLRTEVKQLRAELNEEKKNIKGLRTILKHPVAAVGRKLKSQLHQ